MKLTTITPTRKQLLLKLSPLLIAIAMPVSTVAHDEDADSAEEKETVERYPTHVIADYVLACMNANGNSFESLHQCSCSIDHIMSKITYTDFETVSYTHLTLPTIYSV